MAKQGKNNIKLGVFVMTGLLALVLSLYLIGKNHNLFGSNFKIKAHFSNLNGLTEGSNVLFSGIQAGTVRNIEMINDTSIEVTLLIDHKIKTYIRKNAIATIGTEGLMGNKIINISPSGVPDVPIMEGEFLIARKMVNTDEMIQTLSKTNTNIGEISDTIKNALAKINGSKLLSIFNDKNVETDLRSSILHINRATVNAEQITRELKHMVSDTRHGKGGMAALWSDTVFAVNLKSAIVKIKNASDQTSHLTSQLNDLITNLNKDLTKGKGSIQILLRDTVSAENLRKTIENIQKGSARFNQNMEALKNNFLFRRYFRHLEESQKKDGNR